MQMLIVFLDTVFGLVFLTLSSKCRVQIKNIKQDNTSSLNVQTHAKAKKNFYVRKYLLERQNDYHLNFNDNIFKPKNAIKMRLIKR